VGRHECEQCYASARRRTDSGIRSASAARRDDGGKDGDFAKVPETGHGLVAELSSAFNQIMDRDLHFNSEGQRVRRDLVRHGRLDERLSASPGQGHWTSRVNDVNGLLDALVAPAANAARVLDAVAGGDLTQRVDLHDGNRELRGDPHRLHC